MVPPKRRHRTTRDELRLSYRISASPDFSRKSPLLLHSSFILVLDAVRLGNIGQFRTE